MRNVFNWTIGSFFRTIGRIIAYLIIGAIIALAFTYKPKAATLTPKSIYTSGNKTTMDFASSLGSNNTYNYSTVGASVQGNFYMEVGSTGSAISGKAYLLAFGFTNSLLAQKYYDITINFRDRDLRYNVGVNNITLLGGSSVSNLDISDGISLIGLTNNATTNSNTNRLVIRVYITSVKSVYGVIIEDTQNNITSVNNFGISSITINEVDTTNSQEIINNQTNNTQNIINNNNNNTQQIIDSQSQLLGSKCANLFNKNNVLINYTFGSDGSMFSASGFFATNDFISVKPNTSYSLDSYNGYRVVEYSSSQTFIQRLFDVKNFTTSANTYYIKLSGNSSNMNNTMLNEGSSSLPYCEYGTYSSKLDDTNNLLNNDDTSGATNQAGSFFSNFTTNTHGLTSIITAPLSAIQSLTNSTCTPLVLPIPFVNQNLTLPCMRQIYVDNFGSFMTLYDTITFGIIAYWVLVRIFALVKDFKNPEHDEIEVMDL